MTVTRNAIAMIGLIVVGGLLISQAEDRRPTMTLKVDHVEHEGQRSIRVATPAATWIYHDKGAGFASLIDNDGADWISYHPKGGSDGKYRGIPNLCHPQGYFHPGGPNCTTRIVSQADEKVTLESQSKDGKWVCRWDILPDRARLTVVKADAPYWFLYEGTPGGEVNQGKLDTARGFCLRADGQRTPLKKKWTGDIQGDGQTEWVAFGNTRNGRTLVFIHHNDDKAVDSYWPMQGNMTVFGFGRNGLDKHLKQTPDHYTVALIDETDTKKINATVAKLIESTPEE